MIRLVNRYRWGVILNKRACWVGLHSSHYNKRTCLNLIPCVTIWFIQPGGVRP